MRVVTIDGIEEFYVPWTAERSIVSAHSNAIQSFLRTGDSSVLRPFERERVVGRRLQTDPRQIESWAYQGQLDFADIYTS